MQSTLTCELNVSYKVHSRSLSAVYLILKKFTMAPTELSFLQVVS